MKSHLAISIASLILCSATSSAAQSKKSKPKTQTPPRIQVFAKYDLDHNGNLDVSESDTLREAFQKNPADPILKPFDTNSDAQISDPEIMKIIYPNGVPKPKAKAKPKPKAKAKPKAK